MRPRTVSVAAATAVVLGVGLAATHLTANAGPMTRTIPEPIRAVTLSHVLEREQAAERSSRDYLRNPVPKPKAKPKPKPAAPKPKATQPPAPPPPAVSAPAAVTMACIRKHESGNTYTRVSSTGYQGAYQLSPRYSGAWATRYGYGKWAGSPAHTWPPSVQDGVALGLGRDTHWRAWSDFTTYSCPGFVS